MNNDRKKIVVFLQDGKIHSVKGDIDCTFYVVDNKAFTNDDAKTLWDNLTVGLNGIGLKSIAVTQPAPPKVNLDFFKRHEHCEVNDCSSCTECQGE